MKRQQISRLELASYLLSPSLFVMVTLMVVEAMLAAATTWLVINAGRKVASGHFLPNDLIWILSAQSTSYVAGVISWIFAERTGYRGFGQFMLRFARENRGKVKLLGDKPSRDHIHTVVRTPNGNDYGKDLLRHHYAWHEHSHATTTHRHAAA